MMPALFCLALRPALHRIQDSLPPGSHVIAYLDDIYIVCNAAEATEIYDLVRDTLREVCHIDVNIGKLAAWSKHPNPCPPGLAQRAANVWVHDKPAAEQGLRVLGAPMGADAYVEAFGATLAEEKAKLLQTLPQLPSLQAAWLLLYFCAVPRLNHLLRTTPPAQSRTAAIAHDNHVLNTFKILFGIRGPEE